MRLRELLFKFINEYGNELAIVKRNKEYKRPFKNIVTHDIPTIIQSNMNEKYIVDGSVGKGLWTDVPWIAVFDSRITTSAQRGVYIVYLLNKDTKELFLTLNQGATDIAQGGENSSKLSFTGIATSSNGKTAENLRNRAREIRQKIGRFEGLLEDTINTGSKAYDAGCIYYKKYSLDSLPDDEGLYADLDKFIEAYRAYYEKVFLEFDEDKTKEGDLSVQELLDTISKYIQSEGYIYDKTVLVNFYLSLKAKPFVLLAGTSGTGKTRLVRLFAEAIGANPDERYMQIAVKPDWSDSSDLFGHVDLHNNFVAGDIIKFIKKAADDKDNLPYILCLDEMNLARVEYYFSDFLSVMETREWKDGRIETDKLIPNQCYSGCAEAEDQYSKLIIPENLYIVGTVNMDETTFPFSKKVLDRANTIEFSDVNFELPNELSSNECSATPVDNSFLRSDYLNLIKDCSNDWELVKEFNDTVSSINEILKKGDAHFGYRVRDEIIFYLLYNKKMQLMGENDAMDYQIMQKILPRLQGSSETLAKVLRELYAKVCHGPNDNVIWNADGDTFAKSIKASAAVTYKMSAIKIHSMLRRYEDDDFISFWV